MSIGALRQNTCCSVTDFCRRSSELTRFASRARAYQCAGRADNDDELYVELSTPTLCKQSTTPTVCRQSARLLRCRANDTYILQSYEPFFGARDTYKSLLLLAAELATSRNCRAEHNLNAASLQPSAELNEPNRPSTSPVIRRTERPRSSEHTANYLQSL